MCKLLSYCLLLTIAGVLGDFPESVTRCHRGDESCLKKSVQEVLKKHSGGLRELNLAPFDPLRIKSLILERNPSSPVNIELKFIDLDLIGLKMAIVKETKGFNFEGRSVIEIDIPQLILKGNYAIDGHVLILPITGNGKVLITCENIFLRFTFNLKKIEKNGEIYAELEHVKLEFNPEHVHFQFNNLFNGVKELSDNMNNFLNENWHDIFNELKGPVAKGLGLTVKQMINNVVTKIPYDVLLPKKV